MAQEEYLRGRIEASLRKYLVPSIAEHTKLAFAKHRNDAGMLGAYYHFQKYAEERTEIERYGKAGHMEYYVKSVVPIIESNYNNFTMVEKTLRIFFIHNHEKMDFSAKTVAAKLFVSEASLSDLQKNAVIEAIGSSYTSTRKRWWKKGVYDRKYENGFERLSGAAEQNLQSGG